MYSYIHIPFCNNKCSYCRFASVGSLQEKNIEIYVKYLLKEIKDKSRPYGLDLLSSVYFGGGTPSVLKIDKLKYILDTLKQEMKFHNDIEITLETTPDNVSLKNLAGWKSLGINRLSIGVQTLNTKSLKEIGRGEKGDTLQALDNIKDFFNNSSQSFFSTKGGTKEAIPFTASSKEIFDDKGIGISISLDFIIGLPYTKLGDTKKDIEFILDKYDFIKHISVYMLEDYYSPDKIIETKYDSISYPSNWKKMGLKEKDFLDEYIEVKEFLKLMGFKRYEISNFAKIGYECKHNRAYWTHKDILAFGLGASGFLKTSDQEEGSFTYYRYTNSDNFVDYYKKKLLFKELVTKEIGFTEKLMFGLRTDGISKDIYEKLDKNKLNYFIDNRYLYFDKGLLKLSDKGVLVLDYIIKEII